MKGRVIGALAAVTVWALAVAGANALAMPHQATVPAPAGTAPGSESYFDLARKDCVGTARNTSSKVWF
ncbi:MAG TPA: hypothetical protein VFH80_19690, partial [Solirubrobacteraceae bacterium]|nr:hypothetical protein [Solirubrobacteraceae bacterium]